MSIPGPSRPSLSPSVSKPHSRQSSYTGPLRSPLRASSSFLELTGEQSDDHPLIPPKHRGTDDEDGDDEDSDFWSWNGGDESDISRPTLRRLTSETEKQVAGSSRSGGTGSVGTGSARGSLDLLRMSAVEKEQHGGEVEVLLHQVKPAESLAGIALLYGIDLHTLRKINKLWASDPVHLRTHLYVPIEACKWNKASETFTRGPGKGQITLTPKNASQKKSTLATGTAKGKERAVEDTASTTGARCGSSLMPNLEPLIDVEDGLDPWAEEYAGHDDSIDTTRHSHTRASTDTMRAGSIDDAGDEERRVVDVVRIPSSQLRFFPKAQKPPDTSRRSIDVDMRRISIENGIRRSSADLARGVPSQVKPDGPSIQNDLRTLPSPLKPASSVGETGPKSKMVRIRPSLSSGSNSVNKPSSANSINSLADRLTSFFNVDAPDAPLTPYGATIPRRVSSRNSSQSSRPRLSIDSAFSLLGNAVLSPGKSRSTSITSSPAEASSAQVGNQEVLLEMSPRPPGATNAPQRMPVRRTNKKLD